MIDLAKEIWQTMRTSKLRTFLTGFSVAWGIFILILLLAMANGVMEQSMQFANDSNPNRLTLWGGTTTKPWKGLPEGRQILFHQRSFPAIESADPQHIASISTSRSITSDLSFGSSVVSSARANGVYPEYFNNLYTILHGRIINKSDLNGKRKVMVLSKRQAEQLFTDASAAVGKTVRFGPYPFIVIGVYEYSYDSDPYIPYSTAMAITGFSDDIYRMDVNLKNINNVEDSKKVQQKVVRRLSEKEKFDPTDESAVWVSNRYENRENQKTGNAILNYTMWTIGILTLLTGIIGVSNIMFVSVKERTHEIGVRRAIGAKPRKILGQVIMESVALTTCFGYIGIVMGTLASEAVTHYLADTEMKMVLKVDMGIAIEVTIALIIAGALAGLFPALRALKVNPVEALRDE